MEKQKRTHEIFIEEVKQILGNDYSVISEFKGRKKDITIFHKKCGNNYITKPDGILQRGRSCPFCAKEKRAENIRKDKNAFIKELKDFNITSLDEYNGAFSKLNVKCDICGYEWQSSPNKLLQGRGCRKCGNKNSADKQRYSHVQFLEKLPKIFKQEYSVLEEYKGIHTKIKFKHNICGTEFEKTPNNIISNNQLCPFCFSSNGEKEIYIYLKENNINFYHNYIHPEMERNLRMDFFLYDKNMVIEFDGRQHHEANSYFGGEEEFLKTQERDKYKDQFCEYKNIQILRLTKKDDIKNVLNNIFKVQRLSHGDEISQQE